MSTKLTGLMVSVDAAIVDKGKSMPPTVLNLGQTETLTTAGKFKVDDGEFSTGLKVCLDAEAQISINGKVLGCLTSGGSAMVHIKQELMDADTGETVKAPEGQAFLSLITPSADGVGTDEKDFTLYRKPEDAVA